MTEIILHHFEISPFAEKVRSAFGIKGLAWRSVLIPLVMPKPMLMPLTGGYRRTPVMQIGAHVYCDTACILRQLEKMHPSPSLYAEGRAGEAEALAYWADKSLFGPAVAIATGENQHELPKEWEQDRSAFMGFPVNNAKVKAARPLFLDQLRPQLATLDRMLSEKPFILGNTPALPDLAAYHPLWMMLRRGNDPATTAPFDEYPRVREWLGRMKKIGHGKRSEMTAEEALAVARAAAPKLEASADARDPMGRKPGQPVRVTPDDTGRVPVTGEIVSLSANEIVLKRQDEQVGEVFVHFPRAGFTVLPPKAA